MLEAAWRLPPVVADTRVIVRDGWRQMSGWEMDPAPLRPMHRAMLTRSYRLFVARIGGEPVGVGAYALAGTTAYQMGAVVLPSLRKRGVYRALVAARLADSALRGAMLATSQARAETSAPLLAKLGFEVVCRFPMMTSPPG